MPTSQGACIHNKKNQHDDLKLALKTNSREQVRLLKSEAGGIHTPHAWNTRVRSADCCEPRQGSARLEKIRGAIEVRGESIFICRFKNAKHIIITNPEGNR